jgi:hypothetical protein
MLCETTKADRLTKESPMNAEEVLDLYNRGVRDFIRARLVGVKLRGANLRYANFSSADLSCADLVGAHLEGAKFITANLEGVDFENANLRHAHLRYATLLGANLRNVNLEHGSLRNARLDDADLRGVNLSNATLRYASLRGADLMGANFRGNNLIGIDLSKANLCGTVLDPMAIPNGQADKFERLDGWCVGYRTKDSPFIGSNVYKVGEWYQAPIFSVCETECHPGLYVFPKKGNVWEYTNFDIGHGTIKVLFKDYDCHKAGDKYRVREFLVWEDC